MGYAKKIDFGNHSQNEVAEACTMALMSIMIGFSSITGAAAALVASDSGRLLLRPTNRVIRAGCEYRTRTYDPAVNSRLLYQLS